MLSVTKIITKLLDKFQYTSKEQMAAFFIQDFLQHKPYLPHTVSSLSLRGLHSVINDIVINNRTNLLEFGSGLSTIIFARAIQQNNLPTKIVTVDENKEWLSVIQQYLEKESLLNIVQLVHAPLVQSSIVADAWCYDTKATSLFLGNIKFDSVLIDGPSGWKKGKQNSRVPVLDIFETRLAESFAISIDNADRPGEKLLSKNIKHRLKTTCIPLTSAFHIHVKNKNFSFHY